jgi:hypothetical protein
MCPTTRSRKGAGEMVKEVNNGTVNLLDYLGGGLVPARLR